MVHSSSHRVRMDRRDGGQREFDIDIDNDGFEDFDVDMDVEGDFDLDLDQTVDLDDGQRDLHHERDRAALRLDRA